jgi:hypothetical protein
MRKQEMEIDYLAPFLAQMGDPEKISRPQAYKLKEDCLADLKQRLIDKANLIQARFEKVPCSFFSPDFSLCRVFAVQSQPCALCSNSVFGPLLNIPY